MVGETGRERRRGWLTRAAWVAVAGAAVGQTWAALARPPDYRLADLQMYVGSVSALVDGRGLYDFAFGPFGAPFTYPPFAGLLLLPVAKVNIQSLMLAWTVATLAAVLLLAVLVARMPGTHRRLPRDLRVPSIALLLLLSSAISSNLRFGQVSIFIALAVCIDCLHVVPPRFRGIATGVAAAVKLTPLIFIPYFWLSGQRRTAVSAVGSFLACTGLAWLLLPDDSMRFWAREIFDVDGMGTIASGGNQSLNAALLREGVPVQARIAVIFTVGAAVVLVALLRGAHALLNDQPVAALAIVGAAGIVFSPVSWTHHQIWLALAAVVAVSENKIRNLIWTAFVLAVIVLPVTSVGASLPGGVAFGNLRLLLAIAVAAVMPFPAVRGARSAKSDGTVRPSAAV